MPGHVKCCTCHAKSSSQNWRFDAPKGKPSQEISAWTLMNMCLVLRLLRKMHLARSSWNVPPLPSVLEMLQNHHVLLTFDKVSNPFHLPRETQSEGPKVARTCNVFNFWLRNVLLATTTCTFSTSQLTVQKRSEPGSFFYTLTSKSASQFNGVHFFDISTSKSGPRMVLHILTWKCASRHNGVLQDFVCSQLEGTKNS